MEVTVVNVKMATVEMESFVPVSRGLFDPFSDKTFELCEYQGPSLSKTFLDPFFHLQTLQSTLFCKGFDTILLTLTSIDHMRIFTAFELCPQTHRVS